MKTKDDLLIEMKQARSEYDKLSYQLDFTDLTEIQKTEKKQRKTVLKALYADLDQQRGALIMKEILNH